MSPHQTKKGLLGYGCPKIGSKWKLIDNEGCERNMFTNQGVTRLLVHRRFWFWTYMKRLYSFFFHIWVTEASRRRKTDFLKNLTIPRLCLLSRSYIVKWLWDQCWKETLRSFKYHTMPISTAQRVHWYVNPYNRLSNENPSSQVPE